MTALLYFLVALWAVALASRAWLAQRSDPARQAFLLLALGIAAAFSSFSLSLLPGLEEARIGFMSFGMLLPACTYVAVDRLFSRDTTPRGPFTLPLWLTAAVLAPVLTASHVVFSFGVPRSSPAEVLAGVYAFVAFGAVLHRLRQAYDASFLPFERARIRWLAAVVGLAIITALVEQLARNLAAPVNAVGLSLATRGVALQGAIPPFSAVLTGIALYLVHHSVVSRRMLDLNEVAARAATWVAASCLLVGVDALTFLWVDTFTRYPFHSAFQVFLTSTVFLAAYEPLHERIRWAADRVFNQRGQRLVEALALLERELPRARTPADLVARLLDSLHASGRVARASVYLWSPQSGHYALAGHRGHEQPPLAAVAPHPFVAGFLAGESAYVRADLLRRGRPHAEAAAAADLLAQLHADIAVPWRVEAEVVGWICLRDERWSDGYSQDEIQRLTQLADRCRVILGNLEDIGAMAQQQRLAALGEMAAGLAHEIRNPLAGLKGAAQYLQEEPVSADAREMLQVIVDEAHRLDGVVRQFLDYARPYRLDLQRSTANAWVARALGLLRADPKAARMRIEESLDPDLPETALDGARITQVLLNLLQNAVEATGGEGTLRITTRAATNRAGPGAVEIVVSDDGPGMTDEQMGRLFVPFSTTRPGGTGLGLAISRRIVDAHHGTLRVTSAPGAGATFAVSLPIDGPTGPSSAT